MAANEIHKNDIGTIFEVTIMDGVDVVDLTDAISMTIVFKKPLGEVTDNAAVHSTDGTDGKMRYLTVLNSLDQVGTWKLQGNVEFSHGRWSSDILTFKVEENLE